MRIRLNKLELVCKKATITVPFTDFNYFYGEMGAGKSTIVRLIDFCFGGEVEMTPALQSEFLSVALELLVNEIPLRLERTANGNQILAVWTTKGESQQLVVPARRPNGVVLADTEVEVVSDLLFYIAGFKPPRIRRSRLRDDSDLQRLSFRDLYWYCYLDQDSIDSSFFHLDAGADGFKRLKSRQVLGFLMGFNQQRVAELEGELEGIRSRRTSLEESAETLGQSLKETGIDSETDILSRMQSLNTQKAAIDTEVASIRGELRAQRTHAADRLSNEARHLVAEVASIRDAITEMLSTIEQHKRHRNELLSLMTKFQRVTGARAVLNGVEFERCPRCTQPLPSRETGSCVVCGQTDIEASASAVSATDADLTSRQTELNEIIETQQEQVRSLRLRESRLVKEKERVDAELTSEMERYDSTYLSQALDVERRSAAITEEIRFLERIKVLPEKVQALQRSADALATNEAELRRQLKEAREAAEKDMTNVKLLGQLFLDCLLRAKIAGFNPDDIVNLSSPWFMPEVQGLTTGDATITSFDTLGSGGKKTLFKCCFAMAVHRLAVKNGATLPTLMIIDSPMKNISERENRPQFEGFHQMLYELAETELKGTQFILVDKEYCKPTKKVGFDLRSRHMTVDKDTDPPLIPYYRGK
jgi:hypothetical protein